MKKLITLPNFFLLVIFCIPFYLIKISLFDVPTNVLEILAILVIILIFLKNKELFLKKLLKLPKILTFSCALIIFGILLSIFFNNNQLTGLGILKGWFIVPMFFSFAVYTILTSTADIEKIFTSIYLSVAAVATVAIFYKFFGITTYDNRLSAFYLSPNQLAMYLAPGIFFGLYFLLKAILQKDSFKKLFLHTTPLTIIFISLYYTYSYAAWIAILISLIFTIFILAPFKKQFFMFTFIIFICGVFLFISQKDSEKMTSLLDFSSRSSIASRATIWKVSTRLLKDNIIVGIGPGNFQSSYLAMQKYYPPYLEWAVPQPHNVLLAFWLQAGFLGFIGFLFLLFFIFTTLWQQLKDKKNAALAASLLGFFIYSILHGLVDTTYWKNDLAFLFWICIFLIIAIKKIELHIHMK